MYSSLYGNNTLGVGTTGSAIKSRLGDSQRGARTRSKMTTHSDPLSLTGLEVNVRPLLDHNARLLNGKLVVRSISH